MIKAKNKKEKQNAEYVEQFILNCFDINNISFDAVVLGICNAFEKKGFAIGFELVTNKPSKQQKRKNKTNAKGKENKS